MGIDGKGKTYAAGDADIEAFDAGSDIGIGGEVLGGDGIPLDGEGVTFLVDIDRAGTFRLLFGM
jgi:hypothetical protein